MVSSVDSQQESCGYESRPLAFPCGASIFLQWLLGSPASFYTAHTCMYGELETLNCQDKSKCEIEIEIVFEPATCLWCHPTFATWQRGKVPYCETVRRRKLDTWEGYDDMIGGTKVLLCLQLPTTCFTCSVHTAVKGLLMS